MAPHIQGRANVRHRHSHASNCATNAGCLSVLPSILHKHPYQACYIYKNLLHFRGLPSYYSMYGEDEGECRSVLRCSLVERTKMKKNFLTSDTGTRPTCTCESSKKRTHLCSQFNPEGSSSYISSGSAMESSNIPPVRPIYDHKAVSVAGRIKLSAQQSIEEDLFTSLNNICNSTCSNDLNLPSSILWKDDLMVNIDGFPLISLLTAPQEISKIGNKDLDVFNDLNITPLNNDLYKTELCRSWEETGSCRYGNKCQFAHGRRDLRPISRHPKYKTEICRTFTTNGTCPYGMRCRFIHPCFNLEPNNYTFSEEHKSAYCSEFSDLKALMKFRRLVRRLPIFEEICPVFSNCAMASSFLKIRE